MLQYSGERNIRFGCNYPAFQALLQKAMGKPSILIPNLSKQELYELFYLAESKSDKEMLKYVAVKASRLSTTKAKKSVRNK